MENMQCAVKADACCSQATISFSRNRGRGTTRSKKPRGKSRVRESRVPKQRTNEPVHHVTRANMWAVSCSSGSRFVCHLEKPVTTRERHSRIAPAPRLGVTVIPSDRPFAPDSFSQIKAAAAGTTSSSWVYSSSCVASHSASRKGRHAATKEIAHRKRNADFGARLIIASQVVQTNSQVIDSKLSVAHSMRKAAVRGQNADVKPWLLLHSDF